jgi:SecD/SecF fusion protein
VSEKRTNIAIVGLVVLLLAGTAALFATRDFRLGLDLRGGLEVVLKARPEKGQQVTASTLQTAADIMAKRIDPQGVLSPEIRTSPADRTIDVQVPGVKDPTAAERLLRATGQLQSFNLFKYLASVSQPAPYQAHPSTSLYELLKAAAPTAKRGGAGSWALFDGTTHRQLGRVEPQKRQVLDDISAKKAPDGSIWLAVPKDHEVVSCNQVTTSQSCIGATKNTGTYWYLFKEPPPDEVITGANPSQVSAKADVDQSGQPIVSLSYKNGGAEEFTRMTQEIASQGRAVGTNLPNAIVVDNQLVAAPIVDYTENPNGIDATITGGSEINGVSAAESKRIALEIQSGSLPVKFVTISSDSVSATLGKDSLRNGLIAGAAGLIFVMIFLIAFYGFLGVIADIALLIYGALLAGVVLAIPVTMTLPGIAGTILTIGVAADANIVIFERIKEEIRAGRSTRAAISAGYRKGFKTIIDANVVTIITAVVLYLAATSSVKGFALMLLIGTLTSIFTAVVATRAMLTLMAGWSFMSGPRMVGHIGSGDRWKRYDLIGKTKLWFAISGVVIVIGAISLAVQGLNRGIDFTGGSQYEFTTQRYVPLSTVRDLFTSNGVEDPIVKGINQSRGDSYKSFQVQSKALPADTNAAVKTAIASEFGIRPPAIDSRNVSSSFGESVLRSAYLAIAFSLFIIFLYVSFRFEWKFAVPVMIALFHDILITIGVYSLTGRLVTADTVAAVLTVLGYSLYDTVIVFDRVRENIPILRRHTASQVVNESLAETITRSLNTSLVTLIPVIFLFFFGSGSLQDFAFALIVGIASGAYSSIFVASPLLAVLLEREPAFAKRRRDLAERGPAAGEPAARRAEPVGVGARTGDGNRAEPAAAPPELPKTQRRRRRARPHGRAR